MQKKSKLLIMCMGLIWCLNLVYADVLSNSNFYAPLSGELALTKDQKKKIATIERSFLKDNEKLLREISEKEAKYNSLPEGEEKKILEKELLSLKDEVFKRRFLIDFKILNVLNESQRKYLINYYKERRRTIQEKANLEKETE